MICNPALIGWGYEVALPSSGEMSLQMIAQFFGGAAPHSLDEYYRGGIYVPNIPSNSGIPTAGAISLSNFYGQGGAGGGPLAASNGGARGTVTQNEPAPPSRTVNASGTVFVTGGSGAYTCTWVHVSGNVAIATPAANVFNPSFSASVPKNDSMTAVKRCTVSDGVSTPVTTDMSVTLSYFTNQ